MKQESSPGVKVILAAINQYLEGRTWTGEGAMGEEGEEQTEPQVGRGHLPTRRRGEDRPYLPKPLVPSHYYRHTGRVVVNKALQFD